MKNLSDAELCRLIKENDDVQARNELWERYWDTIQKFVTPDSQIVDPGWDEGKALEWLLIATVDAAKKYDPTKKTPFQHLLLTCLKRSKFFFKMSSTRTPRASHNHVHLGDSIKMGEGGESRTDDLLSSIVNRADSDDKYSSLLSGFIDNGGLTSTEICVFSLMIKYDVRSVRLVYEKVVEEKGSTLSISQVRRTIKSVQKKLIGFLECQRLKENCWCS